MGSRLARNSIYGLLILEAANAGLWVSRLLPSLAVRDRTTVLLVGLRVCVSGLQIVAGVLLRTARLSGPTMARWSIVGSAVLMPLEIGWRLVPTNLDPTYRWWVVVGYWVYAGVAWKLLTTRD